MLLKRFWSKGDDAAHKKSRVLIKKITDLYNNKNDLGIKGLIKTCPINILVDALEELDNEDIAIRFLVNAYKIKMGELFLALNESLKQKMLKEMKSGIFSYLLEDLNSDDVYEIYQNSPSSIQKKIIFNSSKQLKKEIKQLKEFGFAEAGSIMNATYITLPGNVTINEATDFLKIKSNDFDIHEEIFVVDEDHKILGKVEVKKIFLSNVDNDKVLISNIAEKSFVSVYEHEDIDEITSLFKKYNIRSLAVINKNKQMVGLIDYQDIIPEILDSNIEDIYRFYGIKETKKSYINSSIYEIVKSRIACLIMMMMFATFTTYAIDKFESLGVFYTAGISTAILVPIIPIITDVCGNTGSQTTATIIQAYSSGDIYEKDFWVSIKKELKVAFFVGGILAVINFCRLIVYFLIFQKTDDFKSKIHLGIEDGLMPELSSANLSSVSEKLTDNAILKISIVGGLSSSLSLWIVVILSKLFGVMIPLLAIRFNYDPAAISSPILTTILDTVSSIIFFGIGVWMLQMAISPIIGVNVNNGKLVTKTQSFFNYIVDGNLMSLGF